MESDMVNNIQLLEPADCVILVENYFQNNLSSYSLKKHGTHAGYWWVEYIGNDNNIRVYFDGDIGGGFYVKIFIGDTEYHLWQYDKRVNNAVYSTESNILFQLGILGNFLSSIAL